MRTSLLASAALACGLAGHAAAQPQATQQQAISGDGAEQVVGLFSATCLNFGTDVAALRGFLAEQHAPRMPQQAETAFLAGRQGQVFDVSYQTTKLALVSLDDGGCEAVAEHANGARVLSVLNQAAQENNATLTPQPVPPNSKARPGVSQTAYGLLLAGRPVHITVSTEVPAPEAILTLFPK